jgi:hypothetical protein
VQPIHALFDRASGFNQPRSLPSYDLVSFFRIPNDTDQIQASVVIVLFFSAHWIGA